ncbi:hypothetical protein [Arthrobacter sp. H20]|uniref:hypothetical protein n=1 Tax=Arthrobacter sp. H20 TaxID=1267981 RepID=UPI0004B8183B|nr:hypothetical protein [Arthrobacter sp. H20]
MRENTTPLASVFFKMVLAGGLMGTAILLVFAVAGWFNPSPLGVTVLSWAPVFGFFMGLVVAASAAAPAIGLHALAAAKAPRFRIVAAAFGGAAGPVAAVSIFLGASPAEAPVSVIYWALLLPTASLAAVFFTKPLREPAPRGAALSGTRL